MQAVQLTSAYEKLLASLCLTHSDGFVQFGNPPMPVTCEGRRLVIPTHDVLRTLSNQTQIAFHPLSESIVRGESPVLSFLRNLIMVRLNNSIIELAVRLLAIAMDNTRHSNLTPKGKALLRRIPEIAPDCHDQFKKICDILDPNGNNKLLNIFIKRAANIDGESVKRAAIVNFPLLKELSSKGDKVYSKTIKSKNKAVIADLLRFILDEDGDETISCYSQGSNSSTAPSFQCLVKTYAKLAKRINEVADIYSKELKTLIKDEQDCLSLITIPLDWDGLFDDLGVYNGLIPSLDGNEGVAGNKPEEAQQVQTTQQHTMQVSQPIISAAQPVSHLPLETPAVAQSANNSDTVSTGGLVIAKINPNKPVVTTGISTDPNARTVAVSNDPVTQWTSYMQARMQESNTLHTMPTTSVYPQHNQYAGRGFQNTAVMQHVNPALTTSLPLSDNTVINIPHANFGQPQTTVANNQGPLIGGALSSAPVNVRGSSDFGV